MEISENELWILSYYRESELAGSLLFGKIARRTEDDFLRIRLTEHCAEEAVHAWLWTKTILKVGGTPRRVSETYQSRYLSEIGLPKTMLEILALTQVFEKRVMRQFSQHQTRPGTHPVVVATLNRMIDEEAGHISWVRDKLEEYSHRMGRDAVNDILKRFRELDRKVYAEVTRYQSCFRELVGAELETRSERLEGNQAWTKSIRK